jgi:putative oxidoreductase
VYGTRNNTMTEHKMGDFGATRLRDGAILLARILLTLLFITAGWTKLFDFAGTSAHFAQEGLPLAAVATLVAVVMELGVGAALLVGVLTRPLALLLLVYTGATALIGHHFWTMTGVARVGNMINFYKNLGLMGGMLLLYVTGAGRHAADAVLQRRTPALTPAARAPQVAR